MDAIVEIEIKDGSRIKDLIRKIHSVFENAIFSIVMKLPDRLTPDPALKWLDHQTDKRIRQLKHQIVKDKWNSVYLQNAVLQQSKKKAPSDD